MSDAVSTDRALLDDLIKLALVIDSVVNACLDALQRSEEIQKQTNQTISTDETNSIGAKEGIQ